MYYAEVNNRQIELSRDGDDVLVDGQAFELDMAQLAESSFHVLKDNKSYKASVLSIDRNRKQVSVKINERVYEVVLKDRMDMLLEKMGYESEASSGKREVKAPMPGLILDVQAAAGGAVKRGDVLLILEAMKMENVIRSPIDGVVSSVHAAVGDSVDKGQVLLRF